MRILIPTHFPLVGSGSGVYVENLARELVRAGHRVHVIAPGHTRTIDREFPCTTILFAGGGAEAPDLPFNFPCFTTHPRSSNTFYALTSDQVSAYVRIFQEKISTIADAFRPQIIHAQHLWVSAFCAAQTGRPYVVTSHGTDLMGLKKDLRFRPMVETAASGAARVIAVSRSVADDIKSLLGLPDRKLALIDNGFDPTVFHAGQADRVGLLRQAGLPSDTRYIVTFVGKLTPFKGPDVLVSAAARYEQRLNSVATMVIGDGELRDDLQLLAGKYGLRGMRFLGHCSQETVAEFLRIADLHVMPSRGEPFGIAAVEALACGTPVVGTRAGGLPDFITDRVGLLVPVDDPAALAQAVIDELADDAKKTKGPDAAQYALEGFTWEKQVAKILRLYENVLVGA